jgi:hypothetical protein
MLVSNRMVARAAAGCGGPGREARYSVGDGIHDAEEMSRPRNAGSLATSSFSDLMLLSFRNFCVSTSVD